MPVVVVYKTVSQTSCSKTLASLVFCLLLFITVCYCLFMSVGSADGTGLCCKLPKTLQFPHSYLGSLRFGFDGWISINFTHSVPVIFHQNTRHSSLGAWGHGFGLVTGRGCGFG